MVVLGPRARRQVFNNFHWHVRCKTQYRIVQAVVVPLFLSGASLISPNRAFLRIEILGSRIIRLEQAALLREVIHLLLGLGAEQLLLEPVELPLHDL
ncbi:hypothetical protein SSTU70S_06640 [Stutzerimonas stutzeri]